MHPIYLTATFTWLLALGIGGVLLWQATPPHCRRPVIGVWAGALLMSPGAYYLIRVPFLVQPLTPWLNSLTAQGGWQLVFADVVRLSLAPLTEEPAKLLPWLIALALGQRLQPCRRLVVPLAFALGLGFAMGEMWLVAQLIAAADDPQFRGLPWYAFGGYLNERLETCLTHSLFVLPTVWFARQGVWRAGLGLTVGMILHFLGNAPIVLMRRDVGQLGPAVWSILIQFWVLGFTLAGAVALIGLYLGPKMLRRVLRGRMICPECGQEYRQSILLGLNCGRWRYEPCGVCRKWHWVSLDNLAPLPGQTPATSSSSSPQPPAV